MPAKLKHRIPLVKPQVTVGLVISDILAMVLSFVLAVISVQSLKFLLKPEFNDKTLNLSHLDELFFFWLCPIVIFLFAVKGHYTKRVPWWSQVQNVLSVCIRIFIIDAFTRLALDMSFSRSLIALSWIYVFILTLTGRQIVYFIAHKYRMWRIPAIVIGDINTITNMLFAFETNRYTGYNIHTVCLRDRKDKRLDIASIPQKYATITINREEIDYPDYISKNINNFFIISLETFRGEERDELIRTLTEQNALYAVVPPVSRVSLFDMEPSYFFGHDIMLLHTKKTELTTADRLIKRIVDIIASSIALILLSPVMLIIAAMLKLEGQGGSIFYGGYRIGYQGKKFKCWKFRSMEPDSDHLLEALLDSDPKIRAEWETFRKLKVPDPRVNTKTARIIRKASLDELPQLWNVLKGDMSLVGPRPILAEELQLMGETMHDYVKLKPGITGLWQVSGRNDTSFKRRLYWDSWYARNWSLWGDIVIMIRTLRVIIGKGGAY